MPTITVCIETHSPNFSGCIITTCDNQTERKVELRLPTKEIFNWIEAESLYISKIVKHFKAAHREKEKGTEISVPLAFTPYITHH